jgi:FtsP/CotA-like multicopper oxidase with cupredoxin domain
MMVTRRDLIKMGILSSGGFVLLPAGGGFGRVSSFFSDNQFSSPRLDAFVDELPTFEELKEVGAFDPATIQPYAVPYIGSGTRYFEIAAVEREVKFHTQLGPTPVWAYVDKNNPPAATNRQLITFQFPKVVIGQPSGHGFLVRHHNFLTTAVRDFGHPTLTVHFHGGHQPAPADGFPADITSRPDGFPGHVVICPQGMVCCRSGEEPVDGVCPSGEAPHFYDYMYPLTDVGLQDFEAGRSIEPATSEDRPSFLWFHDHILDFTRTNVYRGLANVVPVHDDLDTGDESTGLRLPSGPHDLPLVLQDKIFDTSGALIFDPFNGDGFLGDTFLVNGVVQPFHRVERRKYRLRFLNGSNARINEIFLTNDVGNTFPMTMIATEGGLLRNPIPAVEHFTLAMAERFEVIVDFADPVFDGQTAIFIENRMAQSNGRKPDGVVSQGPKLLKFILDGPAIRTPDVPPVLRDRRPVDPDEIARATVRNIRMDRSHGVFTVNGEPIDIERPIAFPALDQPEIWHIENKAGGWWHPNHIHSEFQRVLLRNGQPPPPEEDGMSGNALKDTVLLRGGDSIDVFFKFRDFTGPFVSHCHNIEHEDMAMMARFDVVP